MGCVCLSGAHRPLHRGEPIAAEVLDAGAPPVDAGARFPFVVVPGYTPRVGWSRGLHPEAAARLRRALAALEAGVAPAVIVSGAAVHSPDNEAILMREWLLAHGVEARRIVVEPCARHSTTNLRNAGRLMLGFGAKQALVITSEPVGWRARRIVSHAFYLGRPGLSGFHARCLVELGYTVGELTWLAPGNIIYKPSPAVLRPSFRERL